MRSRTVGFGAAFSWLILSMCAAPARPFTAGRRTRQSLHIRFMSNEIRPGYAVPVEATDIEIYADPPTRRERRRRGPSLVQRCYENLVGWVQRVEPWAVIPLFLLGSMAVITGVTLMFLSLVGFFAGAWLEALGVLIGGLFLATAGGPVVMTAMRRQTESLPD